MRTQLNVVLEGLERERLELRLFNLQGQVMTTRTVQGESTVQFDLSDLAAGMYLLQVVGADWQVSSSVVKE